MALGVANHAPDLYRMAKWLYNSASTLVTKSERGLETISSSQGVRQGDPLGPLLFSVAIRDTIRELHSNLRLRLNGDVSIISYLDDIQIYSS